MKTAIYIEDGLTQFVLTPETEIDKKVIEQLQASKLKTYRGAFYNCQGGWTRQDRVYPNYGFSEREPESLIFVIEKEK